MPTSQDSGLASPPRIERKKTYYTTNLNCAPDGSYIEKSVREQMTNLVDKNGDVRFPANVKIEAPKKMEWPEHRKPRIPSGAQELLNAYTPKKAKRFTKNCSKPHETPRMVPPNNQVIPFITAVSGTPYGMYQVYERTPIAHLAVATHPEIPKYLKYLEINQKSWITNYTDSDGAYINPHPQLLIGDMVTVKWAELGVNPHHACEFQVMERCVLKNQVMGVLASGTGLVLGLPYPMELPLGTFYNPNEVYRADIFIPVRSKFGDFRFLEHTPAPQVLSVHVDSKLSNVHHEQSDEKSLEILARLGSALNRFQVQIPRGFFRKLPRDSNSKKILESILSQTPAPRGPRLNEFLKNQLEDSIDFSDFLMDYVHKMLHLEPLVIGAFPDPNTLKNTIYSTLARCAGCLGTKWKGTQLIVAEDYCGSLEISKIIEEKFEELKIVRFTDKIQPETSAFNSDYQVLLYNLLVKIVTFDNPKFKSTVIRHAVMYLKDLFPVSEMSQSARELYEAGPKYPWIPETWLDFYLDHCRPDIVVTDRENLAKVVNRLKNVCSVQFEGVFGVSDGIMATVFEKFPDAIFGFVGGVEEDSVEAEPQGLARMSLQNQWRRAVRSGRFTVVEIE